MTSFQLAVPAIVCVAGLAVSLLLLHVYKSLTALERRCHKAFYRIAAHWNRRYELIFALTEQAGHHGLPDSNTLRDVVVERNRAADQLARIVREPANRADLAGWLAAEYALTVALTHLRNLIQSDVDLQANQVIGDLMVDLETTENKIAFARQAYNDWVASFNAHRRSFPLIALACLLGFGRDLPPLTNIEREQTGTAPVAVLQN